jgi:hypothetical protein
MEQYIWPSILIYLAGGIIFALLSRAAARQKGYARTGGLAAAALIFGLPVLVYIACLPDLTLRSAIAGLQAQLANTPSQNIPRPGMAASVTLDPALIAVLAAAVDVAMSEPAAAGPGATAAAGPNQPSGQAPAAGFTIRKVRRV